MILWHVDNQRESLVSSGRRSRAGSELKSGSDSSSLEMFLNHSFVFCLSFTFSVFVFLRAFKICPSVSSLELLDRLLSFWVCIRPSLNIYEAASKTPQAFLSKSYEMEVLILYEGPLSSLSASCSLWRYVS